MVVIETQDADGTAASTAVLVSELDNTVAVGGDVSGTLLLAAATLSDASPHGIDWRCSRATLFIRQLRESHLRTGDTAFKIDAVRLRATDDWLSAVP